MVIDDTTRSSTQMAEAPDAMRRVPKQERSRMMVRAIVEAALKILQEHGREGLSTTSLELVSGVPKASIYDYFPNLDAVVAEVFAEVSRRRLAAQTRLSLTQPHALRAEVVVASIVDPALALHRELLSLDREFYCRYSGFYDLWLLFDELMQSQDAGAVMLRELIQHCGDVPADADCRMLAYGLGRSVQHTIYAMLRDDAQFIDNPQLRPMLMRIGCAVLGVAPGS